MYHCPGEASPAVLRWNKRSYIAHPQQVPQTLLELNYTMWYQKQQSVIAPILTFILLSAWAWAFELIQSKERGRVKNNHQKHKEMRLLQSTHLDTMLALVPAQPGCESRAKFCAVKFLKAASSWVNWTFPTSVECGGSSGSLILYNWFTIPWY